MNISEINKIEKIGSFNLLGENDLGKITPDNNKHFAVITYKNTYAGEKKVSHRSLIIYFICADSFIKKIGYTNSTLSSATSLYGLGAMTGEPGPNRFKCASPPAAKSVSSVRTPQYGHSKISIFILFNEQHPLLHFHQ